MTYYRQVAIESATAGAVSTAITTLAVNEGKLRPTRRDLVLPLVSAALQRPLYNMDYSPYYISVAVACVSAIIVRMVAGKSETPIYFDVAQYLFSHAAGRWLGKKALNSSSTMRNWYAQEGL